MQIGRVARALGDRRVVVQQCVEDVYTGIGAEHKLQWRSHQQRPSSTEQWKQSRNYAVLCQCLRTLEIITKETSTGTRLQPWESFTEAV